MSSLIPSPILSQSITNEFKEWLLSQYDNIDPQYEKKLGQATVGMLPQSTNKFIVSNSVYVCALISNEVYKSPADRLRVMPSGLVLDEERNTDRTCVYRSNLSVNDYYIIGIRGTSALSIIDLASDVKVLFGTEDTSLRVQSQTSFISKLVSSLSQEGYNAQESYITGSSLGGLLSAIALIAVPDIGSAIGFNTGASPAQVAKKRYAIPQWTQAAFNDPRFYNYHMKGDMISLFSTHLFKNNYVISPAVKPNNSIEAHSMTFLIDNIMAPNIPTTLLLTSRREPKDVIEKEDGSFTELDPNSLDSLFVDLEKK